jgi:putative ABC transport system permease protein
MPHASTSLVFTLASRNLFQDRLRFIASLMGIVFSVVLVMGQMGLYFGFSRMVTTVIDHTTTDLWIVSSGARYFEDLSLLETRWASRLQDIDGVAEVIPVVAGFSAWSLPDGAMTSIFIIGSDFAAGGLAPWNIVEGTVQGLGASGAVAIDRSYFDRLGVSGVGATTKIRGLAAKVTAATEGIRSFTTTPYVFTALAGARPYIGLPTGYTTHFLIRVKPEAGIDQVRQTILSSFSAIQVLTPDQFRDESRSFWLFRTGAGAALVAGALLGVIVGTAIVAQTLYSSTKDHLYEFATMRAMGASNTYIYQVIICQALLNAIIGFAIAALIGLAIAHFTSKSAVQIVITRNLMIGLFVLTVAMCIASAIAAIVRVVRVDPAVVLNR